MAIKFIASVPPTRAEGAVADVYSGMRQEFMFAEPIALHAQSPDLLEAFWLVFRDVMVGEGASNRWEREVVAGAVSEANQCSFCVVTHAAMERASPQPNGERDRDALVNWARAVMDGSHVNAPGMSEAQTAELRGVVTLFQYLNRMVSTFMEKASPFDPPANGRDLTEAEQKMRTQVMKMVKAQMALSVQRAGEITSESILSRIAASLDENTIDLSGPAANFADLVARKPSEITTEIADEAKLQLGGDKRLLELAAKSALSAAHKSARD